MLVRQFVAVICRFPWLSLPHAFVMARFATAGFFLAHAVVRILSPASIPSFSQFMASRGFPYPTAVVWAITITELIASTMLILHWQVRWAAAALILIVGEGIILIHRHLGWFVGEHGTGGSEYSVALLALLLLISVEDASTGQTGG